MHLTRDLKLDFLGWLPRFEDGFIDSQSIIAFSALLSFKGRQSVRALYQEAVKAARHPEFISSVSEKQALLISGSQIPKTQYHKGYGARQVRNDAIKKKVRAILARSSLRGHASLSTTPALCLSFQGSKFLDSLLTGTVFSSSLMASGRRVKTSLEDIVYPTGIYKKSQARKLYQKQMGENIDFLNFMLEKGIPKDEASKIMPYGLVGTGTLVLPIESIIGFEREIEREGEWLPEDAALFINKVKKELKRFGLEDLYHTRKVAPRNTYPFPNIFKDPKTSNLARDYSSKLGPGRLSQVAAFEGEVTSNLKKRLQNLSQDLKEMVGSKTKIKNRWYKNLLKRKEICRDYNPALSLSVVSAVSWRVWGEKKRHRTVPQVVDSIYGSTKRALDIFKKAYPKIKCGKIGDKLLTKIDFCFSVPPTIASNKEILNQYLKTAAKSLLTYQKLVRGGVVPRDAIYVVPRGIRILVLQKFDLYNLITGYYPLRICPTAEEQMRRRTEEELVMIKKCLKKEGVRSLPDNRHPELVSGSNFDEVISLIVPKCHLVGFCPEEKFCGKIKALVPYYNEEFHQEMKKELENKFLESKEKF